MNASILSPWTTADVNGSPANVPQLHVDYPGIAWTDATGQPAQNLPTDPNFVLLDCQLEQSVLDAIKTNPDYEIVRQTGEANQLPEARLNRLRGKMPGLVFKGREWATVRLDLRSYLKHRPKQT